MPHLLRIFIVTLSVLSTSAFGKELNADEVRQLQGKIKSSEFLSVDFVQTSFKAMRGKKSTRKGKALFARPDKFKWMLETPVQEYKLYDGKAFYEYKMDGMPAKRYSATGPSSAELKGMVDLVLNFDTLLKRYDLVKAEQNGDAVKIELKPKAESEVTGVELHLDTKAAFISYLRLDLKNKNSLTHEFSNPSHAVIPANALELPQGVKVTDSN